jgi:hypothetical protein
MRRTSILAALCLVLFAPSSSAIQLRWSTGEDTMTFSSATRCTLLVQPDVLGQRLPSEWRLVWVASNCRVQPIIVPQPEACSSEVAQVARLDAPNSPAEWATNLYTAHFCSTDNALSRPAIYVLDLPAGASGKLKIVALDPADPESTAVFESPEVSFNGGSDEPFSPVVLRTTTIHQSTEFQLQAVGVGLGETRALSLAAPDGSWQQPLDVETQSETAITASAALAANVPDCILHVEGDAGVAAAPVAADAPPPPLELESNGGCVRRVEEVIPGSDPYTIQPKDFAFVGGGWTPSGVWSFHLFYIRQNQFMSSANTTKNLGHVASNDLVNWSFPRSQALDTNAVKVRPGRWDSDHVWAPSIIRKGVTYYMFYTGVDNAQRQRIGVATSTDLITWTQGDSVVEVTAANPNQVSWADPAPQGGYGGVPQLRDAFVMENPDAPGGYLMYFVTVLRGMYSPEMVVGVIKSTGNLASWSGSFPLMNTHHSFISPYVSSYQVESPHVFSRNGKWWLFSTINQDSVWATSNTFGPADTVGTYTGVTRWSEAQKLWTLVPPEQAGWFYWWHATEYLKFSAATDVVFLGAFTDDIVGISYTQMRPASAPYLFSMDCPSAAGVDDPGTIVSAAEIHVTGPQPTRSEISFRIELPARSRAHVGVYNVLGRRLTTLVDGTLPAGKTDLKWDGCDRAGAPVGSGVYFISLTTEGIRRSVRVPLIR